MRRDKLRIQDMLDAVESIEEFVHDLRFEQFDEDLLRKSAVMAQLTIIGESAKNISQELKDKYANIEWRQISAMRNVLVHEYFGVEWQIVWDTIQEDLPVLKKGLEELYKVEFL